MPRNDGVRWTAESRLDRYALDIRASASDIVTRGVLDIQAEAVSNSPVSRSGGRLKTGWQAITPSADSSVVAGGIGNNVEYAAYVELGTGAAGAGSAYPFRRTARYTMSWRGMAARATAGKAAARVLPSVEAALAQLGRRLPRRM